MADAYYNEVKEEEVLSSDVSKPAAYSKFAFNVTPTGNMMPTGALTDFSLQFGGNGEDGDFALGSSETYNIDVGGVRVYEINFKSLSITGSASLTFSNPHAEGTLIFIKVQGDANLTSSATPMIDASGMGAAGAPEFARSSGSTYYQESASNGTDGKITPMSTHGGTNAPNTPAAGSGGAVIDSTVFTGIYAVVAKYSGMFIGAGGGCGNLYYNGSGANVYAGSGGNGGGALVMEIGGSWNFTTSNGISVAGASGADGDRTSQASSPTQSAGGGGGGGGGSAFILYRTLISNSGTVNVSGGTGGNKDASSGTTIYGGGGGGSGENAGNNGTSSSASSGKTGGDGGDGYSLVAKNTYYG